VTIIGGKQANPLYTTDLVWDADINPTGITERIEFNKFADLGPLELALVGGQFIASDNTEGANSSTKNSKDAIVYHTQLVAGLKLTDDVKLTVAPGYYTSNGANLNGDGGGEYNYTKWSSTGTDQLRGLKVYTAPGDVSFKVAGKPVKVLWDLAWNADANNRTSLYNTAGVTASNSTYLINTAGVPSFVAAAAGSKVGDTVGGGVVVSETTVGKKTSAARNVDPSDCDSLAYLVGFQIGENKKKGDWSLLANYRQVGLSAIDPNINDSDWSLSYTNMAGYKVGFFYNLGDATTIGTSFYSANNLRTALGVDTAGKSFSAAGPGSQANAVQVLQVDLSVKF